MDAQTVRERIKGFLEQHPVASVKQVANAIGDATASTNENEKWKFYNKVSFYLRDLTDAGVVQNVRYGHYSLTEKELQQRHAKQKIQSEAVIMQPQTSSSLATINIDLENIDVISALKTRYGRQRLLEILEKIKKIIE